MIPFFRMCKEFTRAAFMPPLEIGQPHISHHLCWPIDLDVFKELNNGRTLMLLDLGRIPMFKRLNMFNALRSNGWRITMAGATVRYRRRVTLFQKLTLRTSVLGYDTRFIYVGHTFERKGEATASAVFRVAIVGNSGIVAPEKLMAAYGRPDFNPKLPDWVTAWSDAENSRPWPPEF